MDSFSRIQPPFVEDPTPKMLSKLKESNIRPMHIDSSGLMFSIKNQTGFHPKNRQRFVDKQKQSHFQKHKSASDYVNDEDSHASEMVNNKSSYLTPFDTCSIKHKNSANQLDNYVDL